MHRVPAHRIGAVRQPCLLLLLTALLVTALGGCEEMEATPGDLCADASRCDDGNPCTQGVCDPTTGACTSLNLDAACDDADPCTVDDACQDGQCQGAPMDCPDIDENPCTSEGCSPLTFTCETTPNTDDCDDGDPCTESDRCAEGTCAGEALVCEDDGDVCTDDVCVEGVCGVLNQADCDDGDPCTEGDLCVEGTCAGEALVCEGDFLCLDGVCIDPCVPNCADKGCGDDGCGGVCGTCSWGETCDEGQCAALCTPDCQGKACGSDGCTGSCGLCNPALNCNAFGQCYDPNLCETVCSPSMSCGPDGCGGHCGTCPEDLFCVDYQCTNMCVPACDGRNCGPDGCGGVCGICPAGVPCATGGQCGGPCTACDAPPACLDFSFEGGELTGWYLDGAATPIQSLGSTTPTDGEAMLLLVSGYTALLPTGPLQLPDADLTNGTSQQYAEAILSHCLPVGTWTLSLDWRFYAENFKEWCGSAYQDYFRVELVRGEEVEPLLSVNLDQLCAPEDGSCQSCSDATPCSLDCMGTDGCYAGSDTCDGTYACECGQFHQGLEASDVSLDQGDVWRTPWVSQQLLLQIDDPAPFTLRFVISDVGESIYNSAALIDNLRIQPCTPDCEGKACGFDGCGGQCGTCTETGICSVPKCKAGICTTTYAETGSVCPGEAPCTTGLCDSMGSCLQTPVATGVACDTGIECTVGSCDSEGICQPSADPGGSCGPAGDCLTGLCDSSGVCNQLPVAAGQPCTTDGNICTDDICDGGGQCSHPPGVPAGTPCASDGDPCTADVCSSDGACEHLPVDGECP